MNSLHHFQVHNFRTDFYSFWETSLNVLLHHLPGTFGLTKKKKYYKETYKIYRCALIKRNKLIKYNMNHDIKYYIPTSYINIISLWL